MNVPFYHFNFLHVLVTVLLSSVSCFIAIESSKFIKKQKQKQRYLVTRACVLGSTFWLTHLYISVTMNLPFSTTHYISYFSGNFILSTIASYIALYMAQKSIKKTSHFFLSGLTIGLVMVMADLFGFYMLFKHDFLFRPLLFDISLLLVLGASFTLLLYLIQLTDEDIHHYFTKWRFLASILVGSSLGGIPYMILASSINFHDPEAISEQFNILIPVIFVITSNLFLILGRDWIGVRINRKILYRFQSLFKHSPYAVFSLDLHGQVTDVNEEAVTILGYEKEELIDRPFPLLFDAEQREHIDHFIRNAINERFLNLQTNVKRKDGSRCDILIRVNPIKDHVLLGIYAIIEDITIKKKNEDTIHHLAYHDELTELPNSRSFRKKMKELSISESFAFLFIDFDKFKRINDTFGHSFGDNVLEAVASKLGKVQSTNHVYIVSRLGGDEFTLLVPVDQYEQVVNEIIREFMAPLHIKGYELIINPSIGISLYPEHSRSLEDIEKFADMAMYRAKQEKTIFKLFNSAMNDNLLESFSLENDLRKAIHLDQLMVYYQPKFNSITNHCIGAEALLRWNHAEKGFIPPKKFIPLAEETGLIVQVEKLVIKKVLEDMSSWLISGRELVKTSINITLVTLMQDDFLSFITSHLRDNRIDGKWLELEITERMLMDNELGVNSTLAKLKELGIEISVDDFGTGYSSLSYLHTLSIDRLKIDQSFVQQSAENTSIISAIISLAKNLNLKLIAEGVENKRQLELLKELGCFEIQGFFYSPAIPKDSFLRLLGRELTVAKRGDTTIADL